MKNLKTEFELTFETKFNYTWNLQVLLKFTKNKKSIVSFFFLMLINKAKK